MISSQYGREFTDSQYEKIKKVYSIWICLNPPKNRENTITQYYVAAKPLVGNVVDPVQHYDLLSVITLCLGSPDGENYDGILRMLDVLLSNETSEAEKRQILQNDYDIPMTQRMEKEVSDVCNLSKGVWEKGIVSSIKNMVKNLGISVEQAMTVLEIPEAERKRYMDLLRQT